MASIKRPAGRLPSRGERASGASTAGANRARWRQPDLRPAPTTVRMAAMRACPLLAALAACGPPFAIVDGASSVAVDDGPAGADALTDAGADAVEDGARDAALPGDVPDETTPEEDVPDDIAVCAAAFDAGTIAASNCGAVFQGDPPLVFYVGFTYSANCTPAKTPSACGTCGAYTCACIVAAAAPCGPGIAASCGSLAGAVEVLCQPRGE